ncbi:MAG: hypothetical protein FJW88_01790 [Actinobacteria bacterium]|nr:hypothetical protein [Actinomycetota bacterium]
MPGLGDLIAARVAEWGIDDLPLERALFGTAEPDAIAGAVDAWCLAHLGGAIEAYEFFEASSGSVHGVRLTDGRSVVVKGHRASVRRDYLDAVASVQGALATDGFPAPRPLVPATPCGSGHLAAEVMLRCRGGADGHHPAVRAVLARGFARFVRLGEPHRARLEGVSHPLTAPDGALYPVPHSPRFDFAATRGGAEWIDELRMESLARLRTTSAGRSVVAHGDWRIENVCVDGGEIRAVYDWDSVHIDREPAALGPAAVTFSADWTRAGPRFPSPSEVAAFVSEYEVARGADFDDGERAVLAAAMVAAATYGARCEHSIPHQLPSDDDSQRGLLRRIGPPLLDRGIEVLDQL